MHSDRTDNTGQYRFLPQLRSALTKGELYLVYQPKVDAQNGLLSGYEALMRWKNPDLGSIGPAEFIPPAEATGLIHAMGLWLLQEACQFNAELIRNQISLVPVAVNVSMAQLAKIDFIDSVRLALRDTGLPPQQLELELTESIMLSNDRTIIETLIDLRALGLKISIDDFGTGYSNLSYLKHLPIDKIKIDRSFVTNVTNSRQDAAIVLTIIALAHKLRIGVIAEGVESSAHARFLRNHFCDELQGYHISRPILPAELVQFAIANRRQVLECQQHHEDTRTLLVVDDEPNVLEALNRSLRNEGYRLLLAGSAREALALLAHHPVQVIVCDQRMPDISGIELLSWVKDIYPAIVRIVLSGVTELNMITEAINRGAIYRYLTKPWDDNQLRSNIRDSFSYYQHPLNE